MEIKRELGHTPSALKDQPKLTAVEQYYLGIFYEVTGSRPASEAPAEIAQSELLSYFHTWGINDLDERDRIIHFVRILDRHFVKLTSERLKEQQEKLQKKK